MHPHRRLIIYRWLIGAGILLGGIAWIVYFKMPSLPPSRPALLRETQAVSHNATAFPTKEEIGLLRSTARAVRSGGFAYDVDTIDPSLFQDFAAQGEALDLSLISLGQRRFAIINGKTYRRGDKLEDGRTVKAITREGVILESKGREDRLIWIPPLRVELQHPLKKSEGPPADEKTAQDGQAGGAETRPMTAEQLLKTIKQFGTIRTTENPQ